MKGWIAFALIVGFIAGVVVGAKFLQEENAYAQLYQPAAARFYMIDSQQGVFMFNTETGKSYRYFAPSEKEPYGVFKEVKH